MNWFRIAFDSLPDPRTGNARRHDLLDVLTIALTASICGAESCTDFADFGRDRRALFGEFLRLEHGPPSHDTFSRVFRLLDPAAFARCFGQFLEHLGEAGTGVLAIDGKTLRRSFDRAAGRSPLHLVTAFATGDALHCQGETARLILERGGDWLFPLKANRPALLAEVETFLADPATGLGRPHVTTDAEHGRLEVRRHWVSHEVDWLRSERSCPKEAGLPGLATLGLVEAEVGADGRTTVSRRLYLSSARLDAPAFARAVRAHWRIEADLHWVLDVTFDEDRARNRKDHGPENLATLRKLALNILQTARTDISIRRKRKRSGWSDDFARSIIGQMR